MLKDLPRYECLLEAAQRYPTMNPVGFDAFLNLLRTGDEVFGAEHRFLARHRISQGRFTVLMLLHRSCGQSRTPAELAEESNVTRATMTGLIDTLERDGLASRKADSEDRRTIHVELTERGRVFIEEMMPEYFQRVSEIIGALDASEQRELTVLLQKIQRGPALRLDQETPGLAAASI